MKTYLIADDQGSVNIVSTLVQPDAPFVTELAPGASTLALRYQVVDGTVVDNYPAQTDEEILAAVLNAPVEAAAEVSLKVSPVEFKLLFTPQERMALRAARATDPVLDDFYDIAEDPRLTHIDLGLQDTKDAIGYMVLQGLLTQARANVVLSGTR